MGYISKHHKFNVGDEAYYCSGDGERVYRHLVTKIEITVDEAGTDIRYRLGNDGIRFREADLSESANEAFRAWDNDHPSAEPLPEPPELVVIEP